MINVIAAAQTAVVASGEGAEEMPSVLSVPIDELIIGIIAFLIVAWVVFLVIRAINRLKREEEEAPAPEPEPSAEEKLLTEIRDLLASKS